MARAAPRSSLLFLQEEGTLIGTAMAVCFGYWLGISGVMFFLVYLFNAHLSFVQILSLIVSVVSRW